MKVLCRLLSGQHVPNLLSVHHFKPDRLVLIESADMSRHDAAQNFLRALKRGSMDYSERCDIVPLDNVADFRAIGQTLRFVFGKRPADTWIVNLTGGTKPMSIVAYEFFKAVGAHLVYIEQSRPNELIDVNSGETKTIEHKLSIEQFLLGYGFEQRKSPDKINEAEERARAWFTAASLIARDAPGETLLSVDRERWLRGRQKGLDLRSHELSPKKDSVREALRETFPLSDTGEGLAGKIDKHVVQFLTGGWLEVFLWGVLDRHQDRFGIWDVRLGIEPASCGTDANNDFDIAFMREFALHMIECKSGSQTPDRDVDALYKIEAVTRQFRALRVLSFLATTSENLFDRQGNIKQALHDRASIYRCRFLTKAHIEKLAASVDEPAVVEALLFKNTGRS